jgi:hypothetical protein
MTLFLPKTPLFRRFPPLLSAALSQTQASLQNLQNTCLSSFVQTSNAIALPENRDQGSGIRKTGKWEEGLGSLGG